MVEFWSGARQTRSGSPLIGRRQSPATMSQDGSEEEEVAREDPGPKARNWSQRPVRALLFSQTIGNSPHEPAGARPSRQLADSQNCRLEGLPRV